MRKYSMLIDGQRVEASSGEWIESFNPYTGKPWALIPRGQAEDGATIACTEDGGAQCAIQAWACTGL